MKRRGALMTDFVFPSSDAFVARDGADCTYWFMPKFKARVMGQMLTTTAFGCLGAGTGFALAAKLANRDKQVFLYYGDGTFGLNGMEFDTFVRHNLPILSVISNDSAWGMVKHMHRMWYGEDRLTGTLLQSGRRLHRRTALPGRAVLRADLPERAASVRATPL